jgi:hypothetical protein
LKKLSFEEIFIGTPQVVNSITDYLETKENLKHLKVVLEAPFNCWATSDGHNSFFM